jgi:hypothetical protein
MKTVKTNEKITGTKFPPNFFFSISELLFLLIIQHKIAAPILIAQKSKPPPMMFGDI